MLVPLVSHLGMTVLTAEMQSRRPKLYANSCAAPVHGFEQKMSHGSGGCVTLGKVGLSQVHAIGCHLSYDKAAVICMHLSLDLQIATVALRLLRCSSLCTDSRVSSWSLNGEQGFYRHSLIEYKSARIARTLRVVGCISMAKKGF